MGDAEAEGGDGSGLSPWMRSCRPAFLARIRSARSLCTKAPSCRPQEKRTLWLESVVTRLPPATGSTCTRMAWP